MIKSLEPIRDMYGNLRKEEFACPYCEIVFDSKKEFTEHVVLHAEGYPCHYCDRTFRCGILGFCLLLFPQNERQIYKLCVFIHKIFPWFIYFHICFLTFFSYSLSSSILYLFQNVARPSRIVHISFVNLQINLF